jgi:hypothetical protein
MTTVADIVRGIGYFDEAETLWALLMVCDQCGRRTIDCRDKQPDGWSADDRLMQVGRDLKAQVPLPALSPEPGLRELHNAAALVLRAIDNDEVSFEDGSMRNNLVNVRRLRAALAEKVVDDLCQGRIRWTMNVPAEPDRDPDLVISRALTEAKRAVRGASS